MLTRISEAKLVYNNKIIAITNTQFDIYVDWNIIVEDKTDYANLNILCNRVYGKYEYIESKESFKRKVQVEFSSTNEWKFESTNSLEENYTPSKKVYPDKIMIDFDNKTAKLFF